VLNTVSQVLREGPVVLFVHALGVVGAVAKKEANELVDAPEGKVSDWMQFVEALSLHPRIVMKGALLKATSLASSELRLRLVSFTVELVLVQ